MTDEIIANDDLIAGIVKSLRDNPGSDQSLVGILAEHILKIDPSSSAVNDAATAIERLARERGEQNNQ